MKIIPERSQKLLKVLVERYIQEGEPIGSKTLASDASIALSPATIRNIMADLEAQGYLTSPHTSAGRIPTLQGLRFFIDSLLTVAPPIPTEMNVVQQQLGSPNSSNRTTQDLIQTASGLLSDLTQLVGVVSTPRRDQQLLRRVEFLPLAGKRVLVILVLNEQEVQNRIIKTQRVYTASELEEASNYLNNVFLGKELLEVRTALLALLKRERENLDRLLQTAIEIADKAFQDSRTTDNCVLAGESNVLAFSDPFDPRQLRLLFETFAKKQGILHLLDECIKASGVQIFIGEEASKRGFAGCGVVTFPYSMDGQIVGALGVIGPTRMPYQRVIPLVDVTAKWLSSALNQTI